MDIETTIQNLHYWEILGTAFKSLLSDISPLGNAKRKVRVTKTINIHPLGKMNINMDFHGNPASSCQHIQVWCTGGLTSAGSGFTVGGPLEGF